MESTLFIFCGEGGCGHAVLWYTFLPDEMFFEFPLSSIMLIKSFLPIQVIKYEHFIKKKGGWVNVAVWSSYFSDKL